jgi:hypothetical protein
MKVNGFKSFSIDRLWGFREEVAGALAAKGGAGLRQMSEMGQEPTLSALAIAPQCRRGRRPSK